MNRVAATLRPVTRLLPGAALAGVIAVLAVSAQRQIGGAVMLYALLIGMPLHFLMSRERIAEGINFSAKRVLRFGVALLGVRITLMDVQSLGLSVALLSAGGVLFTLSAGYLAGRACGLQRDFAVLSAGAVAICGASAALAIAAVLPQSGESERNTILTVVGVTALSTVAMVLYPLLVDALGFDHRIAGVFLGASIHDVAQVVGAGYTVSPESGEIATLVKLMRVACLVPAVAAIAWLFRHSHADTGAKVPALPFFLIAFVALMLVNSAGWLPQALVDALKVVCNVCLVTAVAALGVKTSLRGLVAVGVGPVAAMIAQTLLLAAFLLAFLLR